ncbi:hypothetical protein JTF06_12165 [Desemzia sp. RIT804]|uniref:hypothetical protein n=1 Tax=Desemzia sp. RIT 804 TaxID=2810209 RepID=UPI00194E2046|nr:hypothetical protein [Desemzia sp. RIT 804]MBM6615641.1 hypothetical protein [Desemzia sp. RIT 804]
MNNTMTNLAPNRFFLGVPQTDKIQVYQVSAARTAIVTQAILTNTTGDEANLTLTVNTIDVLKKFKVASGETKVVDLHIVLNEGDTISLQQETSNAINVALNGYAG